jgi:serine/threonine protein phosphatase PrpC
LTRETTPENVGVAQEVPEQTKLRSESNTNPNSPYLKPLFEVTVHRRRRAAHNNHKPGRKSAHCKNNQKKQPTKSNSKSNSNQKCKQNGNEPKKQKPAKILTVCEKTKNKLVTVRVGASRCVKIRGGGKTLTVLRQVVADLKRERERERVRKQQREEEEENNEDTQRQY